MNTKDLPCFLLLLCLWITSHVVSAVSVADNGVNKFREFLTLEELEKQWMDLKFPDVRDFKRRRKPYTINVEGIVGTGKSTFLRYFRAFPSFDVLPEPVGKWTDMNGTDMLQLIYDNPKRWGMAQESYVQMTMLQEHLRREGIAKAMERSLQSGRYIFIENLHRSGNLKEVEYSILNQWYEMFDNFPEFDIATDLTVYLQSNPSVVMERIRKRGRKEEANIAMSFLEDIHTLHEDWLVHRNTSFPLPSKKIIVINTSRPFDTMKKIYKSLAKKIWSIIPDEVKENRHCYFK